jgi:hypothetical protein
MASRTLDELRAIVGEDGAAWSDEQLFAAEASAQRLALCLVGRRMDDLNPGPAARRADARRAATDIVLEKRRARYARERQARRRKEIA